jgi:hypothetical protein
MQNTLKTVIITLILTIGLSFYVVALAGDCGESGFSKNVPSIPSNCQYPSGWFGGEQKLSLPSTGETITTQFIPAGASVNVNITGLIGYWRTIPYGADAAYLLDVPPNHSRYPLTDPLRSLNIHTSNGRFNPQPPQYNPDHEYKWETNGTGQSMLLWVGDSFYDDNTGSFNVTVTW